MSASPSTHTADGQRSSVGLALERSLHQHSDDIAFRFGGTPLTRGALLDASRAFATALQGEGIEGGELVLIDIDHSLDLVVALFGVLLAGGCAAPLDPYAPTERRDAIKNGANARLVIKAGPTITKADEADVKRQSPNPDLAFVVYTSGSTGGPKGVEITHANYLDRLNAILPKEPVASGTLDLAWTPSSFIGMLDEFFYPVLAGYPSVVAPPELRSDPRAFADLIEREKVTAFRITPSLLKSFLSAGIADQLASIKTIYCSGETLSADVQRNVHALLDAQVFGFYGATEAPGVGYHLYEKGSELQTTICTPQSFAPMRIVDIDGDDVPLGQEGEIWVGGCAVALGYRDLPELTRTKFVEHQGTRWYRTGDRGREVEGGRIEVLGRLDTSEVNINGVRINLPEVCSALTDHEWVSDAWISVVEQHDQQLLVGHVVWAEGSTLESGVLRSWLEGKVPEAAIPRFFLVGGAFPLLANGKLDVQKLREAAYGHVAASAQGTSDGDAVSFKSKTEERLAEIWSKVLEIPDIHPEANFFALGGNSLRAVRINAQIKEGFGLDLPLGEILGSPTIRQLAVRMRDARERRGAVPLSPRAAAPGSPPLYCLHGLFIYRDLAAALADSISTFGVYIEDEAEEQVSDSRSDVLDMRRLASRYADQILKEPCEQPVQLAGLSRGGLIALEVAQVLRERGADVGAVVLLDTNAPKPAWQGALDSAKEFVRKLLGRGNRKFAKRRITRALYRQSFRKLSRAPYPGDVVVCKAAVSNFGRRPEDLGWGPFVGGKVSVVKVPGNHTSMLEEPQVQVLAGHLAKLLARS